MDADAAVRLARELADTASRIGGHAHSVDTVGWHVSAQQLRNAVQLLQDVERRLRNGDDWRG
jgi:hypothetical protein